MAERSPKKSSTPKTAATSATKRAPPKTAKAATEAGAATKVTAPTAPVAAAPPVAPTREAIAQRAYEIWRAEGGHALDNWLRAERELGAS